MIGISNLTDLEIDDLTVKIMTQVTHVPVMLSEVVDAVNLASGDTIIDGTLGLAGHSIHFLNTISPGGTLIGFDWDQTMLALAKKRLEEHLSGNDFVNREFSGSNLEFVHSDYREIRPYMEKSGRKANGILLDLGLNSGQIEDPARGIAFKTEGPLDMRMDQSSGEPASALLNRLSPVEIERILFDLGDERWAKAIAKSIVERRKRTPLRTTTDLVEAVLAAVPAGARDKRIHPATRTFQAVRIKVNRELDGLDTAIADAAFCLAPGGTLVVLSYHSGEDRAAKTAFRELAGEEFVELFKKPLLPTAEEISRNPRSRSAKMRALRRTGLARGDKT